MPTRRTTPLARILGLLALLALAAAVLVAPARAAAPSAPTGVTVLDEGNSNVLVLWGPIPAAPDVASFAIDRAWNGGAFGQIGSSPATSTGYIDNDFPLTGTVVYRVRALNAAGESSAPGVAAPFVVPALPAGARTLAVSLTASTATVGTPLDLAVAAPADATVRWSFGDDSGWSLGASTSHTFARPGTYVIAVRVEHVGADRIPELGYAQQVVDVQLPAPPPLAVASDLAASTTRRGIVLTWTNPAVSRATSLQLVRVNGTRRSVQVVRALALGQTRYVDTTARRGVRYRYTLVATDGTSFAFSNEVVVTRR